MKKKNKIPNPISNMNEYAMYVVDQEGLKESISIAQVKEVLHIVARSLARNNVAVALLIASGLISLGRDRKSAMRRKQRRAQALRKQKKR